MSNQITTATVQQYTSRVRQLSQQMSSRLRGAVEVGNYTGKAGVVVEQIGSVTPIKNAPRHSDTPLVETPHDRRWVFPDDYDISDLIDNPDKVRMLADFNNPYARNHGSAMARAIEQAIIDAALGTAKTGENGSTSVSASTDGVVTVGGASALTVQVLVAARANLMANEAVMPGEPLHIALTAAGFQDLLNDSELTSSDYAVVKALVNGEINSYMGFQFHHTQLLNTTSTEAQGIAWAQSGIHLGIWGDVQVDIDRRPDKRNSTQVYTHCTVGATRTEGAKVVEVQYTAALS